MEIWEGRPEDRERGSKILLICCLQQDTWLSGFAFPSPVTGNLGRPQTLYLRRTLNSGFPCLHLFGAGIPDVHHHAWLAFPGNKVTPVTRAVLSECVLDGKSLGKYKRIFLPLTGLVLENTCHFPHLEPIKTHDEESESGSVGCLFYQLRCF